jgi:hypothetical protein
MTAAVISFRDNVAGRHGDVLRSSAIFYVKYDTKTDSVISFMDYWKFKRGLSVAVLASTRTMSGELVQRERLNFDAGDVINYRAPHDGDFEGSVEIEVFATQNMVIPYSAIVCIYTTAQGYSVVHGYARAYSPHEIEEGRTLSRGREGCWTLRNDANTHSMAVVHNGMLPVPAQTVRLQVTNWQGDRQEAQVQWPALAPHQSVRVEPHRHFADLPGFLDGKPGHGVLDFGLGAGFSRMLVGNVRADGSDWQVTHSNFDYSRQPTDLCEAGQVAEMVVPSCSGLARRVQAYPDSHAGQYQVGAAQFASGKPWWMACVGGAELTFTRTDGPMPTRLVTAIELADNPERIAGECSLGVITALQPKKRMWWGTVASPTQATTRMVVHDLPNIYGGIEQQQELHWALYSAVNHEPLKVVMPWSQAKSWGDGVALADIWPQAQRHLGGQPGYYTVFCEYGGLSVYSLMQNAHGSVCLEHGF